MFPSRPPPVAMGEKGTLCQQRWAWEATHGLGHSGKERTGESDFQFARQALLQSLGQQQSAQGLSLFLDKRAVPVLLGRCKGKPMRAKAHGASDASRQTYMAPKVCQLPRGSCSPTCPCVLWQNRWIPLANERQANRNQWSPFVLSQTDSNEPAHMIGHNKHVRTFAEMMKTSDHLNCTRNKLNI